MRGRLTAAVTWVTLAALLCGMPNPSASAAQRETKGAKSVKTAKNGKNGVARHFALTRTAALRGNADAAFHLALMLLEGKGAARNPSEAARFMKMSAHRGHLQAQYSLGALYYEGTGVKQDRPLASYWIAKAAGGGYAEAQYAYGMLLLSGDGVPVDKVAAMEWLGKASRQGSHGAQEVLRQLVALPGRTTEIRSLEPIIAAPRNASSPADVTDGSRIEGVGVVLDEGEFSLRFSMPHLREAISPEYPVYSPDKGLWDRIQGGTFEIIYRPGGK